MACHYCNQRASKKLEDKDVCLDCFERLKSVPEDERESFILDVLQVVHSAVLKIDPVSRVRSLWLDELGSRIAFLRRNEPESLPPPVVRTGPAKRGPLKISKFK